MKRDYQKLIQKLDLLREKDPECKINQASLHRYQLTPVLTEDDIQAYEKKWGHELPEEYRDFLKEVGGSGAGPYPLYPLDLQTEPTEHAKQRRQEPFTYPKTPAELQAAIDRWDSLSDEAYDAEDADEDAGIFIIANEGCAFNDGIVLNGPEKGHVWQDTGCGYFVPRASRSSSLVDETGKKIIYNSIDPAHAWKIMTEHALADYNRSRRIGFYDWYDQWLDHYIELAHFQNSG